MSLFTVKFSMFYKMSFSKKVRGHHVYKSAWKVEKGETDYHQDNRDQASVMIILMQYINQKNILLLIIISCQRTRRMFECSVF